MFTSFLLFVLSLAMWAVPGALLSRWVLPVAGPLERAATSLVLGIVTVAPSTFAVVLLTHNPESLEMVTFVSIAWTILGYFLLKKKPLEVTQTPLIEPLLSRYLVLAAGAVALVLALSTTYYAMDTTYMWWHCPHLGSLYLMEDGTGGGISTWDPAWNTSVTNLFMHDHTPGFGLKPVLSQQRPGNMAYLVQPLLMMSNAGLVVALWISDFLILAFAMLLAARHLRSILGITLLAGLFLWGVRVISGYQVNENCIGLVLTMAMLHLLLRYDNEKAALIATIVAGVIAGHLFGIRPTSILLIPAAIVLCGQGLKRAAAFGAAFLATTMPWLIVHAQTFGDPFTHPAIAKIGPENPFLGINFHPLNFPLAPQIMTGPDHPFPALVKIPFEIAQAFGVPMLVAVLLGLWVMRQQRRQWLALLMWLFPIPLGLMCIVQLDYQKVSYILLSLAPLPLLAAIGVTGFRDGLAHRIGIALVAIVTLVLGPLVLRHTTFPLDTRNHAYYTNDDDGIIPERKNHAELHAAFDWSAERERLTTPRLLPTGVRDLDFAWQSPIAGANLLVNARPAKLKKSTTETPIDGPIIVWSALRPNGLEHRFVTKTQKAPNVPPKGPLASSGSGGGYLYLFKFDAPAPEHVEVHLKRAKGNIHQVSIKRSKETISDARYVSFLVVDPSKDAPGQPELKIDGASKTLNFITMWSRPDVYSDPSGKSPWAPQPRVITNYPWSLRWQNGSFSTAAGKPTTLNELNDFKTVCDDGKTKLLSRCAEQSDASQSCVQALVNSKGELVSGRFAPPTAAIITSGSAMWRPAQTSEQCWRALMTGNSGGNSE